MRILVVSALLALAAMAGPASADCPAPGGSGAQPATTPVVAHAGSVWRHGALDVYCRDRAVTPARAVRETTADPDAWMIYADARRIAHLRQSFPIQIIDIRAPGEVAAGTVPGALSVPYVSWRHSGENPSAIPRDADFAALIGGAGIRLDRPTVIVADDASSDATGRAAFVYWVLKSAGAKSPAILAGGFQAWRRAGLPIKDRPHRARRYTADITLSAEWRVWRSDVDAIAAGALDGTLLHGGDRVTETAQLSNLPAAYVHHQMTGQADYADGVLEVFGRLKSLDRVNWEVETVVSVGDTVPSAALNWFYASEISGIRKVKLFAAVYDTWLAADRGAVAAQ